MLPLGLYFDKEDVIYNLYFVYIFGLYFVYILGIYFGFIFWVYILDLYFGFIFWVYILGSYFGFIFWVYILGLYFGFIFWVYILGLFFGFIYNRFVSVNIIILFKSTFQRTLFPPCNCNYKWLPICRVPCPIHNGVLYISWELHSL